MLWTDTFDDHWQPDVLRAGVRVLEVGGYRVIPAVYDFGMLDQAKHQLRRVLTALRPALKAGLPY